MKIDELTIYYVVYWSGQINDTRLRLDTFKGDCRIEPLTFHSVMVPNKAWNKVFCCRNDNNFTVSESIERLLLVFATHLLNISPFQVSEFVYESIDERNGEWKYVQDLPRYENDSKEMLLQLKLDQDDRMLLGTAGKGFVIWDFDTNNSIGDGAIYLALPHGVRNITTKMMTSNSVMVSSKLDYAVAGVR